MVSPWSDTNDPEPVREIGQAEDSPLIEVGAEVPWLEVSREYSEEASRALKKPSQRSTGSMRAKEEKRALRASNQARPKGEETSPEIPALTPAVPKLEKLPEVEKAKEPELVIPKLTKISLPKDPEPVKPKVYDDRLNMYLVLAYNVEMDSTFLVETLSETTIRNMGSSSERTEYLLEKFKKFTKLHSNLVERPRLKECMFQIDASNYAGSNGEYIMVKATYYDRGRAIGNEWDKRLEKFREAFPSGGMDEYLSMFPDERKDLFKFSVVRIRMDGTFQGPLGGLDLKELVEV